MKNTFAAPDAMLLDSYLRQLRLPTFGTQHAKLATEAAAANLGYERYLLSLAEAEVQQREIQQQTRRIQQARLPLLKELADFDFTLLAKPLKPLILELARGEYVARAEPIILVGNPGLGKTHVAIALALCACRQRRKVRFYNAAALVNDLLQAQSQNQLNRFIQLAQRQQLIVLDELGFIPFSAQGAQLIFQYCAALYEHVALILTTNLRFADWPQVFGDERLTAALLDRLTHRAHILEFVGESFRFRQRRERQPVALNSPAAGQKGG
jgi:DNA replication protein DnaC